MKCRITAVIVLIAASSVWAAPPDSGHPIFLVQHASVQKDLAMTAAQVKAVEPLAAVDKEAMATLAKTLDAGQMKRLKQISHRVRGGLALADEAVSKELGLTATQTRKIAAIGDDREKDLVMVLQVTRFRDATAKRKFMLGWRKEVADKMLAELTAEQKTAFEKMQGKKFDTSGVLK